MTDNIFQWQITQKLFFLLSDFHILAIKKIFFTSWGFQWAILAPLNGNFNKKKVFFLKKLKIFKPFDLESNLIDTFYEIYLTLNIPICLKNETTC